VEVTWLAKSSHRELLLATRLRHSPHLSCAAILPRHRASPDRVQKVLSTLDGFSSLAISRLPLDEGLERTPTFFDLEVESGSRMGVHGGQGCSRSNVNGKPGYLAAMVRVGGLVQVEVNGQPVSSYRAEVHFRGRPNHPAVSILGPEVMPAGGRATL
jgi:hypothetical protein